MNASVRSANIEDAASMAGIYNEAVSKRLATFDESLASIDEFASDLAAHLPTHPSIVVVIDGVVVAYASSSPHSTYEPYRSIAEFSVYVAQESQGRGFGRTALRELVSQCAALGFTKMLSRILSDNIASRALCAALGFREVGIYQRHAKLDGTWRDVVIVEKLLETS